MENLFKSLSLFAIIAIFSGAIINFAQAWTAPNGNPPAGSTSQNLFISDGKFGIGITSNLSSKFTVAGVIESTTGGIKFPDGTIQTTAYGGGTTIVAGNVSAGQFGSNTGGGNFSFPANVGIGTANPGAKLHIYESTGLGGTLGNSQIIERIAGFAGTSNNFMNNEWLYRDASGSDWLTARLHDAISIDSSFLTPGTNTRVWWERDPYNNIQSWGDSANTYMTINAGNIGIGTASPTYKLEVISSDNTGADAKAMRLGLNNGDVPLVFEQTSESSSWSIGLADGYPSNPQESFVISRGTTLQSGPKLVVQTNGNIGIATTTPAYPLTVAGIINSTTGGFRFPDGSTQTTAAAGTSFANPAATIGLTAVNGSASTAIRSDAAPALSQSIIPTWTGTHTFSNATYSALFSGGNVGIGTAAPGQKLSVAGTVESTSGGFKFPDGTTQSTAAGSSQWTTSGSNIYYNSGNVGIGNTAPDPAYKLLVGTIGNPGSIYGALSAANVSAGSFAANTGGGNFSFPANLGIGTTSPGAKLAVEGGDILLADTIGHASFKIKSYSNANSLWFIAPSTRLVLADAHDWDRSIDINYAPGTTGGGAGVLSIGQQNKNNANYTHGITRFYTNGGEKMRIDSSGNVGIGTTGPGNKLDVAGTIRSTGGVILNNTGPTVYFQDTDHRAGMIHVNSNLMYFLTANGINSTTWTVNGSYWPLYINLTNDELMFGGAAYFMEGNVGIGTTAPGQKLSVAGTIESTSGGFKFPDGTTQSTAATSGLSGGGTTNYVGKFTGTGTIGNSQIFDNGTGVGIGTAAPLSKLSVGGSGDSNYAIYSTGSYYGIYAGGTTAGVYGTGATGVSGVGGTGVYAEGTTYGVYASGGTSGVSSVGGTYDFYSGTLSGFGFYQVNSGGKNYFAGKVGIATTTPAYPLTVAGTIYSSTGGFRFPDGTTQSTAYAGGSQTISAANVSAGNFAANTGGGDFSFPANVGIGTTSPGAKFHVSNGIILLDNSYYIAAKDTAGTVRTVLYGRFSDNATYLDGGTGGLFLRTNNGSTNAVFINTSGNVGIGATNPLSKLSVGGNGASTAIFSSENSTANYYAVRGVDTATSGGIGVYGGSNNNVGVFGSGITGVKGQGWTYGVYGIANGTSGTQYGGYFNGTDYDVYAENGSAKNYFAGNVGIGTNGPVIKLAIGDTDTGFNWVSDGNLAVYTNNAERMRIDSSGNVGIGAAAPSSKLSVGGNGFSGVAVYGRGLVGVRGESSASNYPGVIGTGYGYGATYANNPGGSFAGNPGIYTNSCTGCSVLAEMAPVAETPNNGDIMCINPETGENKICSEDKSNYIKGIAQKYAESILRMGCSDTLDKKNGKNSMSLGVMDVDELIKNPECNGWYPIALSGLSEETNVVCKSPKGKPLGYGDILVSSVIPGRLRPLDKGEDVEPYQIAGRVDSICSADKNFDSIKVWIQ